MGAKNEKKIHDCCLLSEFCHPGTGGRPERPGNSRPCTRSHRFAKKREPQGRGIIFKPKKTMYFHQLSMNIGSSESLTSNGGLVIDLCSLCSRQFGEFFRQGRM